MFWSKSLIQAPKWISRDCQESLNGYLPICLSNNQRLIDKRKATSLTNQEVIILIKGDEHDHEICLVYV